MYEIQWDQETGGILLLDTKEKGTKGEIRPVFFEELDLLGFDSYWHYPRSEEPLLWALGGRKYYYRGELVAEAEGGGLFTKPQIKIHRPGLVVEPVHTAAMNAKNSALLQGLVQRALSFIYQTQTKYRQKMDITAVAFSGGKDSLVVLDLVQRALEPDQFVVVFGDTGMEISDTYQAVKAAKDRWPHLAFYTAKSAKDALTTWREMGPPSRIHRWCCSVHKSVPTLLLLRQLAGKPAVKALIFDGLRHEESPGRSNYKEITPSGKHKMQTNASPIIHWNAGEVYLYLFSRRLLLNRAYRHGVMRVGCAICPMAAQWWDVISWQVYRDDMKDFVEELRNYASNTGVKAQEIDNFVEKGSWKSRAGGRNLPGGGNRVVTQVEGQQLVFTLRQPAEEWQEWAKTLGRVVRAGEGKGYIERGGKIYPFTLQRFDHSTVIAVDNLAQADRYTVSAFRAVALKSAYCSHCQACQVECPSGALKIKETVCIGENCIACGSCLNIHGKACLTAKSLTISEEIISMNQKKILHTYEHFGLEKEWFTSFLLLLDDWVGNNVLGNRQFDAMIVWLKHAELIIGTKTSFQITDLAAKLAKRGVNDPITWAVLWTNLARHSTPVQWYITEIPWGEVMTKQEWIEKIGETFPQSESTRKNAMTALFTLLTKTPLGSTLGLGVKMESGKRQTPLYKKGWLEPAPEAILYSLYRYAEKRERYELTVHELYEGVEEGPYALFGVPQETLKGILQGLAARNDGFIRANIVRDLDNIFLDENRKASEVLDLA